jgi:hypothetical protein
VVELLGMVFVQINKNAARSMESAERQRNNVEIHHVVMAILQMADVKKPKNVAQFGVIAGRRQIIAVAEAYVLD